MYSPVPGKELVGEGRQGRGIIVGHPARAIALQFLGKGREGNVGILSLADPGCRFWG